MTDGAHPQSADGGGLAQYRARVQRHIRAMVRDSTEAEDLTQDTYARALARIDQLRDPQAALAWLYRIATTVCLDRLRKRYPATVPLDDLATSAAEITAARRRPESLIEAALERSEMSTCVQHYLESLSDDYRVAIILHDIHGLTNPQIAQLLGCSLATVKIRVHRARNRLREMLDAACTFGHDARGVLVCDARTPLPGRVDDESAGISGSFTRASPSGRVRGSR